MNTQTRYDYIFAQHIPDLDAVIGVMLSPISGTYSIGTAAILNSALGCVYYGELMSMMAPWLPSPRELARWKSYYRDNCTFEITYTASIDSNHLDKIIFNKLAGKEDAIKTEAFVMDRKHWLDTFIPKWLEYISTDNKNIHKEVYLYMNNEWGIGRELIPGKTLHWKANHDIPAMIRNRNIYDRVLFIEDVK